MQPSEVRDYLEWQETGVGVAAGVMKAMAANKLIAPVDSEQHPKYAWRTSPSAAGAEYNSSTGPEHTPSCC